MQIDVVQMHSEAMHRGRQIVPLLCFFPKSGHPIGKTSVSTLGAARFAVVSEPLQKIPAKGVISRDLAPEAASCVARVNAL